MEPILAGRQLISRICIVETEALPKLEVALSTEMAEVIRLEQDLKTTGDQYFEPPGLLLEKVFPMLVLLGDLDILEGKSVPPTVATIVAVSPVVGSPELGVPMAVAGSETTTSPPAPGMPLFTATPVIQYENLPPVRFSRNSYFLQANQTENLDALAKHLMAPERLGAPVLIESIKPSGGSAAFNEYLCERRGEEVIRHLTERGVDPVCFSAKTITSQSSVDGGEVRLRVEIPPPLEEPEGPEGVPEKASKAAPENAPVNAPTSLKIFPTKP